MPTDYDLLRRLAERELLARDSHPASRTGPSAAPTRRRDSLPSTRPDPFSIDGAGVRQTRAGAERAMGGDPDVINRPAILPAVSQQGDVVASEAIYGILRSLAGLSSGDFNQDDAMTLVGSVAAGSLPGARVNPGTVNTLFIGPRARTYDLRSGERAARTVEASKPNLTSAGEMRLARELWDQDQSFLSPDRSILQEVAAPHMAFNSKLKVPKHEGDFNVYDLLDVVDGLEPYRDAYPGLRNVELAINNAGNKSFFSRGSYSPAYNGHAARVTLNTSDQMPASALATLDHELNHYAQGVEGLPAPGASAQDGVKLRTYYENAYNRLWNELNKHPKGSPVWQDIRARMEEVKGLANMDSHSHYEAVLGELLARAAPLRNQIGPVGRLDNPPLIHIRSAASSPYVHLNTSGGQAIGPGVPPPSSLFGVKVRSPQDRRDAAGMATEAEQIDPLTADLQAVLAAMRPAENRTRGAPRNLRRDGVPIPDSSVATKLFSDGWQIFARPEQADRPFRVTSQEMLDNMAIEDLLALPPAGPKPGRR